MSQLSSRYDIVHRTWLSAGEQERIYSRLIPVLFCGIQTDLNTGMWFHPPHNRHKSVWRCITKNHLTPLQIISPWCQWGYQLQNCNSVFNYNKVYTLMCNSNHSLSLFPARLENSDITWLSCFLSLSNDSKHNTVPSCCGMVFLASVTYHSPRVLDCSFDTAVVHFLWPHHCYVCVTVFF